MQYRLKMLLLSVSYILMSLAYPITVRLRGIKLVLFRKGLATVNVETYPDVDNLQI